MKEIQLSTGGVALIDDEDYERVNTKRWVKGTNGYAVCCRYLRYDKLKKRRYNESILLHRFVMGATSGQNVDHYNRNKLDCQKANLRFVTMGQNIFNAKERANRSGVRGVRKTRQGSWSARITHNKRSKHLGTFASLAEATQARKLAEALYYGPNFRF